MIPTNVFDRQPTRRQNAAVDELANQYDAIGVTWELPLGTLTIVAACFAWPGDDQAREPVEIDRFRILTNGLTLGLPDGHHSRDLEIAYPVEAC